MHERQVPVERVVERVVTVPQVVERQVPVERTVERLVTVPVETTVHVPVETLRTVAQGGPRGVTAGGGGPSPVVDVGCCLNLVH